MERTTDQRKNEARKLIRQFESKHPDNVTHTPAKRMQFARWVVELDGLNVHFEDDGNRVWYLGEYPPNQD